MLEKILKRIIYHQNKIINYQNYMLDSETNLTEIDTQDMQESVAIINELKEILKVEEVQADE